jgi:hypothetical protein
LTAFRLDGSPDPRAFVCPEVVHDYDLPGMEAGSQNLFDIQFKGCGIGRSFQDQRGSHTWKMKGQR